MIIEAGQLVFFCVICGESYLFLIEYKPNKKDKRSYLMKYILLTGLLLGSLTVQAQVSGTVKDQAGEPIIGANVFWKNIPGGVATREDGTFSISKPDRGSHLIVSFVGYENDTIQVKDKNAVLDVVLREGMELSEVNIVSRKLSTLKLRNSVMNEEIITSDELCRAACCNLGESLSPILQWTSAIRMPLPERSRSSCSDYRELMYRC